ncbi:MAG: ATP-binding cassette domain-containing protein [Burkholderiales bacterium]|jgi:ATP-binding cassette subfamily F protein 3|nr:ATP-binding cassette domain-containing protein [Burkholderiales bacterium]
MIRLDNITLARGTRILLQDVSLTIHDRQKIGIVGANGCGKTSLFALLRQEIFQEQGTVTLPHHTVMAYVKQETPSVSSSALDYVLDGDLELREIEREIDKLSATPSHAPDKHDGEKLAHLHHRFEAIHGYSAKARAMTLLSGLGFKAEEANHPVNTFSGGWRMRLNLAQALMCRSTMLLLDEPTNHLDLDAVMWLEEWLRRYQGTLLLITHDRDFLDNVVNIIAHFDHQTIKTYKGNYAQFEAERAAALSNQQNLYKKQQQQIAHLQSYIDRFRAKATKAKQAKSRLKQLERMTRIAAAHVDSPFSFAFPPAEPHTRQLIRLEKADIGYAQPTSTQTVVRNIEFSLLSDARVGLLGQNGAGKSTFIRALIGQLPLLKGTRHTARELKIGYFAQHQLDALNPDDSPLGHLQKLDPSAREQTLRDFLGGFAFHGDASMQSINTLSGGERARLALALIVYQRPWLLILDEPTNHLDIDMREALIEALQDFGGALLIVAHDRYLLSSTVDSFWIIENGQLSLFDGDLDDYKIKVLSRDKNPAVSEVKNTTPAISADRKTQKKLDAEHRQKIAPLKKRQTEIDETLKRLHTELTTLESWLAEPTNYGDHAKESLQKALTRQRELRQHIEALESEWLNIEAAL